MKRKITNFILTKILKCEHVGKALWSKSRFYLVVNGFNQPLYNERKQIWFFCSYKDAFDFINSNHRKIDKRMGKTRVIIEVALTETGRELGMEHVRSIVDINDPNNFWQSLNKLWDEKFKPSVSISHADSSISLSNYFGGKK